MASTTSDKVTQDRLIEKFIPFARNVGKQAARHLPMDVLPLEMADAEQVAVCGLIEAASRFDIAKFDPTKSSNVDQFFKSFAYPRIRGAVYDEARKNTFVRRRGLEKGIKIAVYSLDEVIHDDDGNEMPAFEVVDLIGDPDLKIDFDRAFKKLTEREQHVILTLGIGGRGSELAEELGVTESRISQIATGARKKLVAEMGLGDDAG